MSKNSIFSKILWSLILILFLVEAFIIFVSLREQRIRITENLINRSETLAKIASRQIETGYYAKILPFKTLELIISESEDIVFLWVVKPDGEIYFANDPEIIMGKRIKEPFLGTEKTLIKDWTYPRGVEEIKLIIQPIEIRDNKGKPWSLLMGISLRSVAAAEKSVILNSLVLFFLTFFLTVYISFYLTKKVTNPLERLRQGAAIIGKGNLGYRIEIKTGDEIEKLAEDFNKMTKDLEESRKVLEESKNILAIKVEAKTRELRELVEQREEIIKQRTKELQKRMRELERFYKIAVGREHKMIELKKEIEILKKSLKAKNKLD